MRAILALLLVATVVGLTTIDPIVCPDGCPNDVANHHSESSAPQADCLICHGWGPITSMLESVPVVTISIAEPAFIVRPAPSYRPSIEHPPRLA